MYSPILAQQANSKGEAASATETPLSDAAGSGSIFENFDWSKIGDQAMEVLPKYGMRLLLALVILFIGFKVANWVSTLVRKGMKTARVDPALEHFIENLIRIAMKVFVIVFAANALGIPITSFIAILGAAGLAIGLALKDGLGNFAGGIILLLFKPIKIGDWITVGDHHGQVRAIKIFYTILKTKAETIVTIPNGMIANNDIQNFSTTPLYRVQALVGISYDDDLRKARQIMLDQIKKDDRIVTEREPFVVVKELGDSSVNLELRCWCPAEKQRRVLFELLENIKLAFDENGISMPYPQRDVHMDSVS